MKLREDLKDLPPYAPGKLKPGAIKLASNENPLGPSPLALKAIKKALKSSHIYPDGTTKLLSEALALDMGVDVQQVLVGNGSDEVLTLVAGAYIAPGDQALIGAHTFSEYNFAVRLFGGTVTKVPLNDHTFDLEAFEKALTPRVKIVFLCNPNNPTGTYFSHDQLTRFLDRVPQDVLVVLDEAYAQYADAQDFPDSRQLLKKYPHLAVMRTFSKIYGLAALRVGYLVAAPGVIQDILVVKQPFNVGTLAQAGARAGLGDQAFVAKSYKLNQKEKVRLTQGLEQRGFRVLPTQANFIAVHVKTDAKQLFEKLMDAGVTIRPLASFGLPDWIRITVGTPRQNDFFLQAFDRVMSAQARG